MHVFGKAAAAADLDYSRALTSCCLLLPARPGDGSRTSQPALLQRDTSQLSIFRANGLGEKAGHSSSAGHAVGNSAP